MAVALAMGGAGATLVLADSRALVAPAFGIMALLASGLLWGSWWPALREHACGCGEAVDRLAARRPASTVVLTAGVTLGAELLLIRWHSSTFALFSYFKNISLLAAFLGLGIGYAVGSARPLLVSLALPGLGAQVVVLLALARSPIQGRLQSPIAEHLALGLYPPTVGHWLLTYGVLVLVFAATVLTCLPLGQLAGRAMRGLPPVAAYGWNLLGSLVAVAIFTLLSQAWTPPTVWLLVLALGLLPVLAAGLPRGALGAGLTSLGIALAALASARVTDAVEFHSPYQIVTLRLRAVTPFIEASHAYFQQIWDLRPGLPRNPGEARAAQYYELPYAFKPHPEHVLVVGSGTGNDVAAALRQGVGAVDAVEIDPVILQLGRLMHPEQPYSNPRVRAVVEDARSFVHHTDQRYDLIVYGLLDSHTALAGTSAVRLDSYVYTVEALRESRAHLTDDGVLSMTFTLLSREIAWKLFLMLREAFGRDPLAFATGYDDGITFLAGPGVGRAEGAMPLPDLSRAIRDAGLVADMSTDDWPFLYMQTRRYPMSFLVMAGVIALVTLLLLRGLIPGGRGAFRPSPFALGAGFMLLETKAITELALVYGSTWQVTSAVIAGVLVMALAANAWVAGRGAPPAALTYGLLAASIGTAFFLHVESLGLPSLAERVLATALATLPLLFSGVAFSAELRAAGSAPALLSSNLMGAMLGGLLEYNSLYLGIRRLALIALALYAAAFLTAAARPSPAAPSAG